jgi:hypothetical protein
VPSQVDTGDDPSQCLLVHLVLSSVHFSDTVGMGDGLGKMGDRLEDESEWPVTVEGGAYGQKGQKTGGKVSGKARQCWDTEGHGVFWGSRCWGLGTAGEEAGSSGPVAAEPPDM